MKTVKTVVDEKPKITDERIGKIQKKTNEIVRRINEGTISYEDSIDVMQKIIIEGKSANHLDVIYKRASINKLDKIIFPEQKWFELDNVIYIKVIFDGTTGEQWIKRLYNKPINISSGATELLLSEDFKVTTGFVCTIAILKGSMFDRDSRINRKIRKEAAKRKLITPTPELACLIGETLSNNELKTMGLDLLVVCHNPIKLSNGGSYLLCVARTPTLPRLCTDGGDPYDGWAKDCGFIFEVSRSPLCV